MSRYYLFINNTTVGPYTADDVREMLTGGTLAPESLIAPEGGTDWQPVSGMFGGGPAVLAPPPVPMPMPMPSQHAGNAGRPGAARPMPRPMAGPSDAQLNGPLRLGGAPVPGTEGLSAGQVVELVKAGGKFVIWQYAISLVYITFRRSSPIRFLKPGETGAGSCLGYSLITGLLGWWGLPWGLIYTPQVLFRNMFGGQDVTEPVLGSIVGPGAADQIMRTRPKKFNYGALIAVLVPIVMVVLLFKTILGSGSSEPRSSRAKTSRLH